MSVLRIPFASRFRPWFLPFAIAAILAGCFAQRTASEEEPPAVTTACRLPLGALEER
jgi:hypothetical protein